MLVSPGTLTGLQSIEGGVLAEHRGAHHRVDMACLTVARVDYGRKISIQLKKKWTYIKKIWKNLVCSYVLCLNLLTAISSTYRVESLCSEEPTVSGPDPPGHQRGGERKDQREQQRRPHHGQTECLSVSERV